MAVSKKKVSKVRATTRRAASVDKLNMTDLLKAASKDRKMAAALIKEPKKFAEAYNLDKRQLDALQDVTAKIGKDLLKGAAADIEYE